MKLSRGLVLLASVALAACGSGKPEGIVAFHGFPPNTSKQNEKLKAAKTIRQYTTACPGCGKEIEYGKTKCPSKVCAIQMSWAKAYPCASCKGSGLCNACVWMDQPTGECYNCRGKGDLIINGQARDCPNCKGKKTCPICEGSRKCDWCKGDGKVTEDFVKAHLMKGSNDEEAEEKKPDEKKPEEKKPEEKKPDEKKPDEKKPEEKQ
jgi:hypothetical protein